MINLLKFQLVKWEIVKTRRFIVTVMSFLGFLNAYALRGSLSVAIVGMTKVFNVTLENGTITEEREFNWNSKEQGLILSAFFYGYISTQILGGILATRFGGHIVFGVAIGVSSILMILSPFAAKLGINPFIAVRILIGLFEGASLPSVYEILSNWAPIYERTTMVAVAFNGANGGTFTSFLLSGYLAEYLGWESVFYVFGGFGCLWCIFWMIYIKRDPASDPRISPEERSYIEANLGDKGVSDLNDKIPWKKILTSPPVYAIFVVAYCDLWTYYTLMTQIPTYITNVLKYNLGTTGFLSAAPYLVQIIVCIVWSRICDHLRSHEMLTTEIVRKISVSCGLLLSGSFLIIVANSTEATAINICLNIAIGISCMIFVGYMPNGLDIAPRYTTIIMSIANSVGILPGIISPMVTGYIVQDGSPYEWKIVFYITAAFGILGTTIYTLFAKGEIQDWAKNPTIENTTRTPTEEL